MTLNEFLPVLLEKALQRRTFCPQPFISCSLYIGRLISLLIFFFFFCSQALCGCFLIKYCLDKRKNPLTHIQSSWQTIDIHLWLFYISVKKKREQGKRTKCIPIMQSLLNLFAFNLTCFYGFFCLKALNTVELYHTGISDYVLLPICHRCRKQSVTDEESR